VIRNTNSTIIRVQSMTAIKLNQEHKCKLTIEKVFDQVSRIIRWRVWTDTQQQVYQTIREELLDQICLQVSKDLEW